MDSKFIYEQPSFYIGLLGVAIYFNGTKVCILDAIFTDDKKRKKLQKWIKMHIHILEELP